MDRLRKIPDFYLEIDWKVQSWIPLVSNFTPSDTFKIWKKGTSIRFDSGVRGFSGTTTVKGHISYVATPNNMVFVDHDRRTFENAIRKFKNPDYEELIAATKQLMDTTLGRSSLRTNNVNVSMKKSLLGYQKTEKVGEYNCNLASCTGIKYSSLEKKDKKVVNKELD